MTKLFKYFFDQTFLVKTQTEIATRSLIEQRDIWKANLLPLESLLSENLNQNQKVNAECPPPKLSKKYFEKVRRFTNLVPSFYKRTAAPRLMTLGSAFSGMKKVLLITILKKLSLLQAGAVTFIDCDMSARIQESQNSYLRNPTFIGVRV